MGMSGTQARLLQLTARMHDIEYKAQQTQAQKLQLAIDQDTVYQNYCAALDKTKTQVAFRNDDGTFKYVDANFDSVCTYKEGRVRKYALHDAKTNQVYLNKEQADLYEISRKSDDLKAISEYRENSDNYTASINTLNAGITTKDDNITALNETLQGYLQKQQTATTKQNELLQEIAGYDEIINNPESTEEEKTAAEAAKAVAATELETVQKENEEIQKKIDDTNTQITNAETDISTATESKKDLESEKLINDSTLGTLIEEYKEKYGVDPESDLETYDKYKDSQLSDEEKDYYDCLFELVDNNGYKVIDGQYTIGDEGFNWFNSMVKAGLVTISEYIEQGASKGWSETDVTTSVNNNYLQEVEDEVGVKKAEAEYEHELNIINQKDKEYDNTLTKLETEEKALQEERDSLKKVIEDNEKRTFGIFG